MLNKIKENLKKRHLLTKKICHIVKFLKLYSKIIAKVVLLRYPNENPKYFKHPRVLQLPITYKCNCDCIMCGMQKMIGNNGFSAKKLDSILCDKLFENIRSVGVNGGEPFMLSNLDEYINNILNRLHKLKDIYIISNGNFTDKTLNMLEKIYKLCKISNVKLHMSISIDGIGETHNTIRGKSGIFNNAIDTAMKIRDSNIYCDSIGLICTITKYNIENINEVDIFAKLNNFNIFYNIATLHKRLSNEDRYDNFSIFTDEQKRILTIEWFYKKFIETENSSYFALYYYVLMGERVASCDYKRDGVTITPDGLIAYCATCSDSIIKQQHQSYIDVFKDNICYREKLVDKMCKECSHYANTLTLKGDLLKAKELLKSYKKFL